MKHQGTKRLETDRLILRKFIIDDAAAMYNNWTSDPDVTKYLMWPYHKTIEISKAVLTDWINQYSKEDSIEMVRIGYCIGRNGGNRGLHLKL